MRSLPQDVASNRSVACSLVRAPVKKIIYNMQSIFNLLPNLNVDELIKYVGRNSHLYRDCHC